MRNLSSNQSFCLQLKRLYTLEHFSIRPNAYLLLFLSVVFNSLHAQVAVTLNSNATSLAQMLAGSGVTITNITKSCNTSASGTFTSANTNLGLAQGIVLATGKVSSIPQGANSFASTALTGTGDPQLSTLTVGTVYDPCILEFDVVPQGDTLQFKYVFASEEYPEFVCSQFNDVFGFFITGPNPAGGAFTNKNIATIPNSTLPVCINSVNGGVSGTYNGTTWNSNVCLSLSNTIDYVDNLNPVNANIVYDGMTTVLHAITAVVPCQTYHLKIAIADVGDRFYDSGVFLEAYSFTSTPYSVSITSKINDSAYAAAYEGCMGGTFTVSISSVQAGPVTVALNISGTATNGVDYNNIPTNVVIPAGQTSVTIPLTAIQDNIAEGAETVTVAVFNQCSGTPGTSATITIMDDPAPSLTAADTILCPGQPTQLTATGGKSYVWTPATGLSSSVISNPIATPVTTTTYTANITWGTCVYQLAQTVHVDNPAISLGVSPSDTVCPGTTVQLTASGSNGISPYSYLWSTGNITNHIGAATSGSYSVTVTDANLCTAKAANAVVISTPVINNTVVSPTCGSPNSGSISLSVSGGTVSYTYLWSDGATTQDRNGLAVGIYTVTVTDAKGCTANQSINLIQATVSSICNAAVPGFVANLTGSPDSVWISPAVVRQSQCCTANFPDVCVSFDITLDSSVLGIVFGIYSGAVPSGSLYYQIDCGPYTTVGSPICLTGPCDHHLTFCKPGSNTNQYIISSLKKVTVTTSVTNSSCFNSNNGAVNLNVLGGYPPYTFKWSDGSTAQNRTNLAPGNYTVTVMDSTSCFISSTSATIIITQPAPLNITATPANVSCFAGNNGAISLSVTGGTPAYIYNWAGGITTQNRINLIGGNYAVTVTDSKGCSTTSSTSVTQPAAVLFAAATGTNINCFGVNTGSINLSASGGITPYTYNWGGGIVTQNRTNLGAGTYNVTVNDANGCSFTTSAVITQPASALSASATPSMVSCFGGNNGTINSSVTGGTAPYIYSWNGGAVTANIASLVAGTYTLTVTDAKGCTATAATTVAQPASALVATIATGNASCFGANNGTINVTVTGGTTAYSYNWGGGVITQNRTNLNAGTYTVTVTDSKGCSVTSAAIITQPSAALAATATATNINCFGGNTGAVNLVATGGTSPYIYIWGGGVVTQNRTNIDAGNYIVTVTDSKGCSATTTATVTQPSAALAATATAANVICFGGSTGAINLVTTGGTTAYSYNWGGGVITQNRTNLRAGTYTVTVTDSKGCSVTSSAIITQPSAALAATASSVNINCFGGNTGAVNLVTTGGTLPYIYNWGGGLVTQNRTNLVAGTYNVTINDANGCFTVVSSVIVQPAAALSASAGNIAPVLCFGNNTGSVNLNVSGGSSPYNFNWSNGGTSQTLSNVAAGSYSVSVTDAQACTVTASAIVTQPLMALNVSLSPLAVRCYGGNNGSIATTLSGGTAPYSFQWNDGNTLQNRSGVIAGVYQVTATDASGCSTAVDTNILQPLSSLNALLTAKNVSCFAGNDGTLQLSANGGTSPYTYNWNDGVTTANRTNLAIGVYTLTVSDANACSVSIASNLAQPLSPLSVSANSSGVSCYNGNNGSIVLQASGGTSPYVYNWASGVNGSTQNNLSSGIYMATVTDANGCVAIISDTVLQPASGVNVSVVSNNIACYGDNGGVISVIATGGTTPYNYTWTDGLNGPTHSGLLPGSYVITVTDAHACSVSVTGTVTQPAQALKALAAVTNVSCNAGSNGAIMLTVSGGTPPYSFKWAGGPTTQNRTQLVAGNYQVTVSDANACQLVKLNVVLEPIALAVSLRAADVSCFNGNNGAIALNASGGTMPYAYNWGQGINTQNRNQLTAGNYTVTLTDANSCNAAASVVVGQPATALNLASTVGDVSCYGGNNGTIQLNVTGGTSPYSFVWNTGSTLQNNLGLIAGVYHVSVTDHNGCSATAMATVTQPANAVSASAIAVNVKCFGGNTGAVSLNVRGGASPYSFNWNSGQTTQNISNLPVGNYTVVISDAHNCSASSSILVIQPASALVISLVPNNVSCFNGNNGNIHLSANGGTAPYNYSWTNGSTAQNIQNIVSGNYHVTVTDNNGCSNTSASLVTQPSSAISATIASIGVSCFGGNTGSLNAHAIGGTWPYNYNWGGGVISQNRNGLSAGNYSLTVTDANSCSIVVSASVTQPASAIAVSASINNVECFNASNGNVNLNVSGGTVPYSYNWGGGVNTQNRTNLAAGTYRVTVTDGNDCSIAISANVTQPQSPLALSLIVSEEVSCYNGSNGAIQLIASGGTSPYTYHWTGGAATANRSNLAAGTYHVTVTDNNGCSITSLALITQPASVLLPVGHVINNGCFAAANGAIMINTTGGTPAYSYNWGGGITTQNRSNLAAGNYVVTVTDSKGCLTSVSATVSQPVSGLNLDHTVSPVSCYNGTNGYVHLNVSGGTAPYTFNWNGGSDIQNRNNLAAGNYVVTVTDANGCSVSSSMVIATPDSISLTELTQAPNCYDASNGKVQVNAFGGTPGYRFLWSTGSTSPQISNVSAGTYAVTVTDLRGCTASLNSIIVAQPAEVIVAVSIVNGACAGSDNGQLSTVTSGGTAPYQYQWSNSKATAGITHLSAGTYVVTVTDANMCTQSANATVNSLPGVSGVGNANPLPCQNAKGEIVIHVTSGVGPYTFKWSDGATTQDINVHPGAYSVTVQDANGCSFDTTFMIENLNTFSVQAFGGGTIKLGETSELHAIGNGSAQTVYNWTPGSSLSCTSCPNTLAKPAETTTYTVVGVDTNGCNASDTVSVIVIEDHTIFTPNAFTPNGDGNNDYFQIFGNLGGIHTIEIKIFNRWGEKVFESEDPNFKWDGTYKGVLQNPCVFAYEMKIVFLDGRSDELKKGSITLVR